MTTPQNTLSAIREHFAMMLEDAVAEKIGATADKRVDMRVLRVLSHLNDLEAENAKLREIIEEAYDSTVDASTYPDGPCIAREIRAKMRDVLNR